jgi:hypothetical protein
MTARAHRFYERLGLRFVERRRFGNDDCFVYRLAHPATPFQSGSENHYTCNIHLHSGR